MTKSLFEIKGKIKTAEGIKKVVKATAAIANTRLQNILAQLYPLKTYKDNLFSICKDIYCHIDPFMLKEKICLFTKRRPIKILFVVFTSDKGLCGLFNNKVLSLAYEDSRNLIRSGKKLQFITVGKFANDFLNKFKRESLRKFPAVSLGNIEPISYELSNICFDLFSTKEIDEIYLYINSYSFNKVLPIKILPLEFTFSSQEQISKNNVFQKSDFEIENNNWKLIEDIFCHFFQVNIKTNMYESLAKEHSDRMIAMQEATNNAEDLINKLVVQYNKIRQYKITKELLEIVSSAEALK